VRRLRNSLLVCCNQALRVIVPARCPSVDQGLISFLPNVTWLQPPAHAHAMIHDSWCDTVLNMSYGKALGQSAIALLQDPSDRGGKTTNGTASQLVIRYVNAYHTDVKVSLKTSASGGQFSWQPTNVTVLKPPTSASTACLPQCAGSYYDPTIPPLDLCCSNPPAQTSLVVPGPGAMDSSDSFTAAAFSFTVVTLTRVDSHTGGIGREG
jgi:hypothetical protein